MELYLSGVELLSILCNRQKAKLTFMMKLSWYHSRPGLRHCNLLQQINCNCSFSMVASICMLCY